MNAIGIHFACSVGVLLLLIPSLYDFILIFICCFVFPELLSSFTFSACLSFGRCPLFQCFCFGIIQTTLLYSLSVAKDHRTRFRIIKAIFSICEHVASACVCVCIELYCVVLYCVALYSVLGVSNINSIYLHVWIVSLPGDISITERCRTVPMLHYH